MVALAWLFVLLEMEREPARAPDCVGRNEIFIMQVPFAATEAGQLFV